jgi:hypothetical protein
VAISHGASNDGRYALLKAAPDDDPAGSETLLVPPGQATILLHESPTRVATRRQGTPAGSAARALRR